MEIVICVPNETGDVNVNVSSFVTTKSWPKILAKHKSC